MNQPSPDLPDPEAAGVSRIRREALALAGNVAMVAFVLGLIGGAKVLQATGLAVVGALGGLLAWNVYHRISRQNNGLALVTMSLMPPISDLLDGREPSIGKATFFAVCLVFIAVVLGLLPGGSMKPSGLPHRDPGAG